jgi:RyR domain
MDQIDMRQQHESSNALEAEVRRILPQQMFGDVHLLTALAKVCHEANRAYCASLGDPGQPAFDDAPTWQTRSAISGATDIIVTGRFDPELQHDRWMRQKLEDGWRYGATKDAAEKTHPSLLPYRYLSAEEKGKDRLFAAVVTAIVFASDGGSPSIRDGIFAQARRNLSLDAAANEVAQNVQAYRPQPT